ncbi:hypothetical protein AM587_10000084 [Phytophthora nicotianae]|uniref:Uncharacterized protein n=1 Tax=Phytophthora nicotianae TaxID=4792 RepID=A0A0W8DWT7_PHYNI|nr:hypothetical protein AM587_10000084 [Phytophthora nicotianae]
MARTKQNASRSTGGQKPRASLSRQARRKTSAAPSAATSPRWHVWTISDRLGAQVTRDSRYYVEYIISAGKTEGSWEPRWLLEEDGFTEYLELVDQYKTTGGPMTFAEFALSRPDDFSQAMGASRDGRCAFRALDLAADALGISDWYSEAAVDALYCVRAATDKPITSAGVVWSTLWTFIRNSNRAARAAGRAEICEDTISVNQVQFRLEGVQACIGLDFLLLAPGVYLCAGVLPGPQRKSHAFMLQVTKHGRFVSDESLVQMPLLECAFSWLAKVRFVRRVLIRQNTGSGKSRLT